MIHPVLISCDDASCHVYTRFEFPDARDTFASLLDRLRDAGWTVQSGADFPRGAAQNAVRLRCPRHPMLALVPPPLSPREPDVAVADFGQALDVTLSRMRSAAATAAAAEAKAQAPDVPIADELANVEILADRALTLVDVMNAQEPVRRLGELVAISLKVRLRLAALPPNRRLQDPVRLSLRGHAKNLRAEAARFRQFLPTIEPRGAVDESERAGWDLLAQVADRIGTLLEEAAGEGERVR